MTDHTSLRGSLESAAASHDTNLPRLRWRCRRGMRELDEILSRYLDRAWPMASLDERTAFAQLIELQDPELLGYLVGRAAPAEENQRAVIACIRRLAP